MRNPGKLTPKQKRFCQEFIIDSNATQAFIRAGFAPRSAHVHSCGMMAKPQIQDEIARLQMERAKRLELKADDVLLELLRLARVDLKAAYDENGNLKPVHEIPEDTRRAIAGIEIEELFEGHGKDRKHVGTLRKVKFWDKVKSLELLGKHLKLWVERIEVQGLEGLAAKIEEGRARAANR